MFDNVIEDGEAVKVVDLNGDAKYQNVFLYRTDSSHIYGPANRFSDFSHIDNTLTTSYFWQWQNCNDSGSGCVPVYADAAEMGFLWVNAESDAGITNDDTAALRAFDITLKDENKKEEDGAMALMSAGFAMAVALLTF